MGRIKEKTEYTEELIQDRLHTHFMSMSNIKHVMENLFVFAWESDLLLITKSDIIYEFEIKISKYDFKNDFKNKTTKHAILESCLSGEKYTPLYYEMLEESKKRGTAVEEAFIKRVEKYPKSYLTELYRKPNYFYYAVPENLISEDDIPEYAGLIYMMDYWPYFKVIKQAPKIHAQKYTAEELNLVEKFYYNYRLWKYKSKKENDDIKLLNEKIDELSGKPSNENKKSFTWLENKLAETQEHLNEKQSELESLKKEYNSMFKDIQYDNKLIIYLMRKLTDNGIEFERFPDFDE